jgi:hypothetical protein
MRLAALGQKRMEIAPSVCARNHRLVIDERLISSEAANRLRLAAHSAIPNS